MKRILPALSFLLIITACSNHKKGASQTAETLADSQPGQCPYLTKDVQGNTVMSWVRMTNDSGVFCFASSHDGKTFSKPIVITASHNIQPHGENLPKIIYKPSGEIIALWGEASTNKKNKYAGMVFYVQSFDKGQTWSAPKPLTPDTASYDQRYYDVALLLNGEAAIIWLDNRKSGKKEGSGLYFATTKGRDGFVDEHRIAEGCCQCCRTDLFIDSKGGIHTLYRGILQDSIRDMVHAVSTDGGKNFSVPRRISDDNWVIKGCPHTGPAMTETLDGLQFAWFTGGRNKGCFYASSKDNGTSFSPRRAVSEAGSHPQILAGDKSVLIAWDETVQAGNKVYKRIGVERRMVDGSGASKTFLTADTSMASFPVLAAISRQTSLVAYTIKKGNKEYICCQSVPWN